MASMPGTKASQSGMTCYGDVVEVGLLLPANWAEALVEMSKRKQQSVGQLLRAMIDRGLSDDESYCL